MPMIAFGSYRGSLTTCSVQEGIQQWLRLGGSHPQSHLQVVGMWVCEPDWLLFVQRRHVDTAHDYGTEPDVGAAISASGVARKDPVAGFHELGPCPNPRCRPAPATPAPPLPPPF